MSNETGLNATGVSTSVPNWLKVKALKARYAAQKVWGHCLNAMEGDANVQGQIKRAGDRVTLQIFPSLSATDISTTDGTFTNSVINPTSAAVVINKWKNVSADMVDIVDAQSVLEWETEFAEAFGKAIGQKQDDDLLALVASLTINVDATGGAFTDPKILAAQLLLDNLEIPKDDRCWAISPGSHADLLGNDKFTLANTTGFTRGVQVAEGRVVGLYGTPVEVTSRITTTSSKRDNVLFHREAFGVIMQKDFKMEKFSRVKYSTPYAGSALYGVATLRDNHAVWVTSAA